MNDRIQLHKGFYWTLFGKTLDKETLSEFLDIKALRDIAYFTQIYLQIL